MKKIFIALLTVLAGIIPVSGYEDIISWDKDYTVNVTDSTVLIEDNYLRDVLIGFDSFMPMGEFLLQFLNDARRGRIKLSDYLIIKDWLINNSTILDEEIVRELANAGKSMRKPQRYFRELCGSDNEIDYDFDRFEEMQNRIARRMKYAPYRKKDIERDKNVHDMHYSMNILVGRLTEVFDTYDKTPWKVNSVMLDFYESEVYFIIKALSGCEFTIPPYSLDWQEFNLFKDWLFININSVPNSLLKELEKYYESFVQWGEPVTAFPPELAEKIRALNLVSLSELEAVEYTVPKDIPSLSHFY